MHTGFCCESSRGRDHLEDLGIDGRIICKVDLEEVGLGWGGSGWYEWD